jgi:hypothetical protein
VIFTSHSRPRAPLPEKTTRRPSRYGSSELRSSQIEAEIRPPLPEATRINYVGPNVTLGPGATGTSRTSLGPLTWERLPSQNSNYPAGFQRAPIGGRKQPSLPKTGGHDAKFG